MCTQENIRGPVEPLCWASRVGPPWTDPPGPKKVPKKPGKNFSRAQNLSKRPRPPGASSSPVMSRNQRKRAHRRKKLGFWCPRCAWGVASGYIKSQKQLKAILMPSNEQRMSGIVQNPAPLFPTRLKYHFLAQKCFFSTQNENLEVAFGYAASVK